jgi:hypothetical protein
MNFNTAVSFLDSTAVKQPYALWVNLVRKDELQNLPPQSAFVRKDKLAVVLRL